MLSVPNFLVGKFLYDGPALVIDWVSSIEVDSSAKQKPQGWGFPAVDAKK
jgi:hypothetical protein